MNVEQFRVLIRPVAEAVAGRPVVPTLGDELDRRFPPEGGEFRAIESACASVFPTRAKDVGSRMSRWIAARWISPSAFCLV